MQNRNETHQSNTTLFQKEYHFIQLHVSTHTESSSGIRTKHLKHRTSMHYTLVRPH
jgi:hypothetical protein